MVKLLLSLLVVMVSDCWRGVSSLPNGGANDILSRYPGQDDYITPTRAVWSAVGGRANLFCNLSSPIPGDPALLVLWYKKGIHKPIYSYDMRNGPPTHWKNPESFGSRATFDPEKHSLMIHRVLAEDEGTYRCRVDFRTNPTLEYITNLTVVVPPRRLAIYTDLNVEARSIVGPFNEGDDLRLTCRVSGGSPPPRVTWWEGETLLDMTPEVQTLEQVTNTLVVLRLKRRDLHRTLTCQASNTNLTAPLVSTVSLDMNFPPLWVRYLGNRDPLSAGRPYVVSCQTAGARPSALITWMLDNEILTTHTDKTTHEGNVTTSELRWTPSVAEAGKLLQCRAESPGMNEPPLADEWTLDIYYVPLTSLLPGRSLNLSNIEEGDDVYFECSIQSNPWVYKIIWLHEGHELYHNVSAGIIISNQSLVLQRVARTASGNYYCVASNIEGDGHSNPILLNVKYTPVCRPGQLMYHGAARYEQVNIPCHLEAHPKPTSFTWTFNNSGESVDIPQTHIQVSGTYSTVSYTPNTELDYGTLLCWGTNAVGKQKHPCVFHVFPAGLPDPVHNCSVYNLSVELVNVRCVAGFDGGLEQTFILELYDPHTTNKLVANTTNLIPTFSVPGLPPGMAFTGVVYSTNGKGRGEMVSLQVYTIKDVAERRTAEVKPSPKGKISSKRFSFSPILAVVLGVGGGLMVVGVVICAILRFHYGRRRNRRGGSPIGGAECRLEPVEGIVDDGPSCQAKMINTSLKEVPPPPTSPRDSDEKNPDVIPQSDSDSWHIEGVNTISSSALPSTYASLPHSAHLYSQANYQVCPGGSDVNYAELMLCGPTTTNPTATPTAHHREAQVVYATLDHKHHNPYPHSHQHQPSYPHASTANNTPKHTLHQPPASHSHHQQLPTHSGHPQGSPHMPQGGVPWSQTSTLGRRHSLRRDPVHHDHEASVPLMPNQKESSV